MTLKRLISVAIPLKLVFRFRIYKGIIFASLLAGVLFLTSKESLASIRYRFNRKTYFQVSLSNHKNLEIFFDTMSKLKIRLILLDPNATTSFSNLPISAFQTFGVFENSTTQMRRFSKLFALRLRCVVVTSTSIDYRLMDPQEEKSKYVTVIGHYFFISSAFLIHLAVVYRRNDFFWVPALNVSSLPSDYAFLADLPFKVPLPMAVDAFECLEHRTDFCIPQNMNYYLWQLPRARFHECHYEDVVYPFKREFPNVTELENTSLQADALHELYRASKRLQIPAMIFCGTLLGWYRQCNHITHAKDVDTVVMSDQIKTELLIELFRGKILIPYIRYGSLELGLEFRTITSSDVLLDIFSMYDRNDSNLTTYMWTNRQFYVVKYPLAKGVCSAELLGGLVYLPCNYEDFIFADYGKDGWYKPYDGHYYVNINMELEKTYEETEQVYMEHFYVNKDCTEPNLMWYCDAEPPDVVNSTLYQEAMAREEAPREAKTTVPKSAFGPND